MVKEKLGDGGPKKVFQDEKNLPCFIRTNGRVVFIRKAKTKTRLVDTFSVGETSRKRNVCSESNHHVEIFEYTDKKGGKKWDGYVVSLLEAKHRLANGEPVVRHELGEGKCFLFSLTTGDTIELDNEKGVRSLYVIRSIPKSKQIFFVSLNDARLKKDIRETKDWLSSRIEPLRQANCKKVIIDPIGRVRWAND